MRTRSSPLTRSARRRAARRRAGLLAAVVLATSGLATGVAAAAPTPRPSTPTLPVPKATVDPATAIGGPRLASMGIVTDLPAGVPPPPVMRDVAWLVADLDTGDVIAAKAPHARLAPASTLKTLTSIVLLPRISPTRSYVALPADERADGTRIGLVPGQAYTGRQLFQALLLGSANDAAYMLSRLNGGFPKTLEEMNEEARRLGALDTRAGDPSGLDAPGQTSSAYDLALIARQAMRDPAFRAYVATRQVDFPGKPVKAPAKGAKALPSRKPTPMPTLVDAKGVKRQTYALSNHNALLFNYPGTIGVKNGFTDKANRTYISAATRGGHTYLVTEMWGLDFQQWRPTAKLLDWAFANGSKARPVGRLVEPGEALPAQRLAELSSTTSVTAPTASPATAAPPTAAPPTMAAALTNAGPTGRIAPSAVGGAALACAVLLGVAGVRRSRRRRDARH